ncbi:subtilase family protein [Oxobacter pfennigii]|uniref:Subtilase family protein n=1 Tax=Oxobacter pfennigii TaxID=36849 RepID=A0A0P8W3I7_9CLOT|nr:S8/S53 family peptidase [Oxobacter pfennigii]KPU42142.1 subtilase family protein [Oxobacter pfennigii]
MLSQNKKTFDYGRISDWHKAGYTGKGVNIAVLDDKYLPHVHTKAICPLNDSVPIQSGKDFHKPNSCSVNREVAPEASIYAFNWFGNAEATTEWLIEHKDMIDVVNCSFESPKDTKKNLLEQLLELDIPFVFSTGNSGGKTPKYPASMDGTIKIGAYNYITKEIPDYSNGGEDALGLTYIYIPNSKKIPFAFEGTSAAASVVAAMLGMYCQLRKENGKPKLTTDIAREFIRINSKSVDGHRLFLMPRAEEIGWKNEKGQNSYLLDEDVWLK